MRSLDWVRYGDEGEWHAEIGEKLLCSFEFSSDHDWFHRGVSGSVPSNRCADCVRAALKAMRPSYDEAWDRAAFEDFARAAYDLVDHDGADPGCFEDFLAALQEVQE